MGSIKLPHASGNSMSIAAPATNPASDLELKLPATIGSANQLLKNSGTAGTLEFASNLTLAATGAISLSGTDDPVTITVQNTDSNTATDSGGDIVFKGSKTNGDPLYFGGIGGRRRNQASDQTGYLALYRQNGDGSNAAVEALRIDHSGNMALGTTTVTGGASSGRFCIEFPGNTANAFKSRNTHSGDGNAAVFITGSTEVGSIVQGTSGTSYNESSDYRLKENQVEISDGITRLKTLKPYRFNWKVDPTKTVDGFFAHELTAVPEAIKGTKDEVATEDNENLNIKKDDPIYQQIDKSKLVPLLTAALKEAITKIETLETKVAALEAA